MIYEIRQKSLHKKYDKAILNGKCKYVRFNYLDIEAYDVGYDGDRRLIKTLSCTPIYKIPHGANLQDVFTIFSFATDYAMDFTPQDSTLADYIACVNDYLENHEVLKRMPDSQPCTKHIDTNFCKLISTADIREDNRNGEILDLIGFSDQRYALHCDVYYNSPAWYIEGVTANDINKIKSKIRAYETYYESNEFTNN